MPAALAPYAPGPAGYRPWQRALAYAALAAVLAPLLAGLAAPMLVERYVQRALRAAGYADAVVHWRMVGTLRAEGRLRLDATQSVERIVLDYGPPELLRGRLARVRIDGLRLRVERTADDRYALSGLRVDATAPPPALPALPFARFELSDARIDLPLPDGGRLALPLTLTVQTLADGARVLDGTFGALAPGFGARFHGTLAADGALSAAAAFEIADTGPFLVGLDRPLPVYGRLRGVVRLSRAAGAEAGPGVEFEADGDGLRWDDWLADGTLGLAVRLVPTGSGPDGPGGYALYALRPLTLAYTPGPALAARLPPELAAAPLRLGLHAPDDEPVLALPAGAPARLAGDLGLSLGQIGLGGPFAVRFAAGRIEFALREAALGLPAWAMAGERLALTGELGNTPPYALHARLTVPALTSSARPARHAPLALAGRFDGTLAGVLGYELALELADGPVLGRLAGRHDFADGRGELHLRDAGLALGDDGAGAVPLATLSPALAAHVEAARGRIAARADVVWGGAPTQARGELRVTALDLAARGVRAQRIDGVLRADRLLPLHVPPGQSLAIARLDAGLPLTDGLVELAVDDGRVQVRQAEFALAGGRLRLDPLTPDPVGRPVPVGLMAHDVDLGRLLELVAVDGLAGDGTLNGRIDARLEDGELRDLHARFETAAAGVLRYAPQSPPAGLADGQAGIALEVLRDFRYESLVLTLAGARTESLAVGLAVRGANPAFYGGHPVALNLSLTGAVTGLLQQSLDGYHLPDAVRRRLEQYEREQP